MDEPAQLRITVLGSFGASVDGRPLDLGGPRQRAVLALLLLARGETVPRDRLAESVWGEAGPADTDGALQAYVSHLRRRLSPGSAARSRSAVIVSEGRGYAVRLADDAVDAWRFEAALREAAGTTDPRRAAALLDAALALWRGPALAEYADEAWAQPEIARLAELRTVARERLLGARLELGEAALLVPDLEALVAEEPLREERWRLLALALYRAHRQADALAALRRARDTLADELGVDPGPALRTLEEQVLAQAPELDRRPAVPAPARAPDPAPAGPPPRPAPAAVPPPDDLVDRDRELACIRSALADLAAGVPGVVLIEGPAGIGKTRLLAEARRLAAASSVRVLAARGSQLEKAFGFGAVRQLLEPELTDPGRRERLLAGPAASARGVFDLGSGDPADGSFAVVHGLYWLTVNLAAGGPVLLAVDDVQWCDSASLRYLAYLVRRLEGVPVLVVGTVRTGELHDDEELLAEIAAEPSALVVRPGELSPAAITGIVAQRLGGPVSPPFAAACARTTSGNPLLLRQLLRALETDGVRPTAAHADAVVAVGSRAVSSMVLMRLRRLAGVVPAVARAAAVLGDGAPLPAVAALAELPEPAAAAALATLARAEIVKDEQPVAFVHPLVREAVYRDLPAAERALRHERAAAILAAAGAPDEQVAAHLLLAPLRGAEETVTVLQRAARTAADRGAADSAVTLLRRALEEPPAIDRRRELLRELGMIETLLDGAASTQHLLQAYALHDDDPRLRADLAIAIARTHVFAAPPGVATTFAREAAAALPAELADERQALLALERISGFMHGLDPATWQTPDPPEPTGDGNGARMLATTLSWETTIEGADRARAVRLARMALHEDRLWAVDNGLFWIISANVLMLADEDLGDFWERAAAEAHTRGSLFAAFSTSMWSGFWYWRRGELLEALVRLGIAYDQDRLWGGFGIGEPYSRTFMIACQLDRGDLAAAREAADLALAGPMPGEGGRILRQAVARVLIAEGRPAEALAELDAAVTPVPVANPVWNPWRGIRAEALAALGERDEAVRLAAEEVDLLRRWGAPSALGAGLRLLGEVQGAAGEPALREAVDVLAGTSAAVHLARARCALGRQPSVPDGEAVPLLRAALDAAVACGALGIRRDAVAGLADRGVDVAAAPVPARRPSAIERRIVELVGDGVPVHRIAQQLLLTPGTVQTLLEGLPAEDLKNPSSTATEAGALSTD
ncbi:BTAD domain-containing putative transcriptional regulator [Blastococcus sp. SYSU D00820]